MSRAIHTTSPLNENPLYEVSYTVIDGTAPSETHKVFIERLKEAQLIWDTLHYLRGEYVMLSVRPR